MLTFCHSVAERSEESKIIDQAQTFRAMRKSGIPQHYLVPRSPMGACTRTLAMATGRPKNERETETDRDKTPILYKRD